MAKSCFLSGLIAVWILSDIAFAGARRESSIEWQRWQELPVQSGGRHKPLDTLAWETLRLTSNRARLVDLETGERLSPTAVYLTLLFEWSGWDHEQTSKLLLSRDWAAQYFYFHQADRWDKRPLLRVDHPQLQQMLGLPADAKNVAPFVLATASIVNPRSGQSLPFTAWERRLLELQEAGTPLTQLEEKALELAGRLHVYQSQRMGATFAIIPTGSGDGTQWMTAGELLLREFDDAADPNGHYRRAQGLLWQARAAFREGDAGKMNRAIDELLVALRTAFPSTEIYPNQAMMSLEISYNRWAPFRFAWILMLLAAVGMLLHLGSQWRALFWSAIGCYGLGILALSVGFLMRAIISGRPPVTNMYESVVYVGCGVAIIGALFEAMYRTKYILTAAAAVSTIALILADNCPAILDPSVRPLEPVLRSNFWLVTHVMTITLSYAAFALALGIANITLGYFLARSEKRETIRALSQFTYRAIQAGVLLLAAGIILGGVWADYSWGRFWGWDPKEVWALVALLGYLAVLHARFGGAVGHRGLAALSVFCFSLIVMAWYGVNFVLGAGLHSYGFGGGGQSYVYTAVFLQWLYAAAAIYRSRPVANPASLHSSQRHRAASLAEPIGASSNG